MSDYYTARNGRQYLIPEGTDTADAVQAFKDFVDSIEGELPFPTYPDNILVLDANNEPAWSEAPPELPPYLPMDEGKSLVVAPGGTDIEWGSELPDHDITLDGRHLAVGPTGALEWVVAAPAVSELKPPVADLASLPTTGNTDGDIRVTLDDQHMHIWVDGTPGAWHNIGSAVAGSVAVALTTDVSRTFAAWKAATAYPTGSFVESDSQIFMALVDHASGAPAPSQQGYGGWMPVTGDGFAERLLTLSLRPHDMVWKGIHNPTKQYAKGEVVTDDGNVWVALKHVAANAALALPDWQKMVSRELPDGGGPDDLLALNIYGEPIWIPAPEELPYHSMSDDGFALTVFGNHLKWQPIKGLPDGGGVDDVLALDAYGDPQWVTPPSELPVALPSDDGRVLTATDFGGGVVEMTWEPVPSSPLSDDKPKPPTQQPHEGTGAEASRADHSHKQELPARYSTQEGQALFVGAGGVGVEWGDIFPLYDNTDADAVLTVESYAGGDYGLAWKLPLPSSSQLKRPVADKNALPMVGNSDGDMRVTLDDQHIHIWINDVPVGSWHNIGAAVAGSVAVPLTTDPTATVPDWVAATVYRKGDFVVSDSQVFMAMTDHLAGHAAPTQGIHTDWMPVTGTGIGHAVIEDIAPHLLPEFGLAEGTMTLAVKFDGTGVEWVIPMQISNAIPERPGIEHPGISSLASAADHIHQKELPDYSVLDADRHLSVDMNGALEFIDMPDLSDDIPELPGVGAPGVSDQASRGDHVHQHELPNHGVADGGKVLFVEQSGQFVEWAQPHSLTSFKPAVADAAALPATGNTDGDVRITLDDGNLHVWSGTGAAWSDIGPATSGVAVTATVTPEQTAFTPVIGQSAEAARADHAHLSQTPDWVGSQADYVLKVATDAASLEWVDPSSFTSFKNPVATKAALPPTGNDNGDVRLSLDDSHLHIWQATAQPAAKWIDLSEAVEGYVPMANLKGGNVILNWSAGPAYRPGTLVLSDEHIWVCVEQTTARTTPAPTLAARDPHWELFDGVHLAAMVAPAKLWEQFTVAFFSKVAGNSQMVRWDPDVPTMRPDSWTIHGNRLWFSPVATTNAEEPGVSPKWVNVNLPDLITEIRSGVGITVADVAPTVGDDGSGWFDSVNGTLAIAFSGAWVQVGGAAASGPKHWISQADPTAGDGADGDIWLKY